MTVSNDLRPRRRRRCDGQIAGRRTAVKEPLVINRDTCFCALAARGLRPSEQTVIPVQRYRRRRRPIRPVSDIVARVLPRMSTK